jgi:hypothetical protein
MKGSILQKIKLKMDNNLQLINFPVFNLEQNSVLFCFLMKDCLSIPVDTVCVYSYGK